MFIAGLRLHGQLSSVLTAISATLSSEFDGESEKWIPDLGNDFKVRIALFRLLCCFLRSSGFMNLVGDWRIFCFTEALFSRLTGDREVAW